MAPLTNHRQERFCQLVKQGHSRRQAYPLAGYKPDDGAPYRLSANVRVKRRLTELTKALAMKTRVTVESITDELDQVRVAAMASEQHSAAQAAIVSKAKLHGLLIDRKESGAPGDFQTLQSAEDVLAVLAEQLGGDVAALLRARYEAGALVQVLPAPEPARPAVDLDATPSEGNA